VRAALARPMGGSNFQVEVDTAASGATATSQAEARGPGSRLLRRPEWAAEWAAWALRLGSREFPGRAAL